MSCDICGRHDCIRAFHSIQMQQANDDAINSDKSNLLSEIAALREQLAKITEDRLESHRRWDAENAARMKAEAERDKVVAAFAHLKSFVSGDLQEHDAAEVASMINAALKEHGK